MPEPWFLQGSGAPSWPERCQNHGFCRVSGGVSKALLPLLRTSYAFLQPPRVLRLRRIFPPNPPTLSILLLQIDAWCLGVVLTRSTPGGSADSGTHQKSLIPCFFNNFYILQEKALSLTLPIATLGMHDSSSRRTFQLNNRPIEKYLENH